MTTRVDTVLEIDTPEHLAFNVRIAGLARRGVAWMIDLAVRGLILFVCYLGFIAAASRLVSGGINVDGIGQGVFLILLFVLNWFYFVVCESLTNGRSPGKAVMRLRVVGQEGLPISWRESMLRNLLRGADLIVFPPYVMPVGPVVMVLDPMFRRLGDLVAGTMVVVEEKTSVRNKIAVQADSDLVDQLPRALPLDHDDLEALELFVHREHMNDARREELAQIIAPEYAARLGMPAPENATRFLASLWKRVQDPGRSTGP